MKSNERKVNESRKAKIFSATIWFCKHLHLHHTVSVAVRGFCVWVCIKIVQCQSKIEGINTGKIPYSAVWSQLTVLLASLWVKIEENNWDEIERNKYIKNYRSVSVNPEITSFECAGWRLVSSLMLFKLCIFITNSFIFNEAFFAGI